MTRLLSATRQGNTDAVLESLRDYGLPRNYGTATDYVLMTCAVENNQPRIVRELLRLGCRFNELPDGIHGFTPLSMAVFYGYNEIANDLLDAGARVNDGTPAPLVLAANTRNAEILIRMLQEYPELEPDTNHFLLDLFVDRSLPNPQLADPANRLVIAELLSRITLLRNQVYWSLLHYVVTGPDADLVLEVLRRTQDVNLRAGARGETALHVLLRHNFQGGEEALVELVDDFIDRGARVDLPDGDGETACHVAASLQLLSVLRLFLDRCQLDLQHADSQGNTVLHLLLATCDPNDERVWRLAMSIMRRHDFRRVPNARGKRVEHVMIDQGLMALLDADLAAANENFDVSCTDERLNGDTLLHYLMRAIALNPQDRPSPLDRNCVWRLIARGARADLPNTDPRNPVTPLEMSFEIMDVELVRALLTNFDVPQFEAQTGRWLLHLLISTKELGHAATSEQYELRMAAVMDLLLKNGAKANARDPATLATPLGLAGFRRLPHVVVRLLDSGAPLDPSTTRLIIAAMMGEDSLAIAHYLGVDVGVNLNIRWPLRSDLLPPHDVTKDTHILSLLVERYKLKVEEVTWMGLTIFQYAATNRCTDMMRVLLTHVSDEWLDSLEDVKKNGALHWLAKAYDSRIEQQRLDLLELVKKLLDRGIDVNRRNRRGVTPLLRALARQHWEVARELIDAGADYSERDFGGNNVFHFAAKSSREDSPETLAHLLHTFKNAGLDFNARNRDRQTPISVAARFGSAPIAKALLSYGAQIDAHFHRHGSTLLHIAAEYGHSAVIVVLLEHGMDIDAQRTDGRTAVYMSDSAGQDLAATETLIDHGADTDVRDSLENTALHYACHTDLEDKAICLLKAGADPNALDHEGLPPIALAHRRCYSIWLEHYTLFKKMLAAALPVTQALHELMIEFQRNNPASNQVIEVDNSYANYADEVRLLKATAVADGRYRLYDALRPTQEQLPIFRKCRVFDGLLVESGRTLREMFPHYADLIIAGWNRAVQRRVLQARVREVLPHHVIFGRCATTCGERVMSFLDEDYDVRRFYQAAVEAAKEAAAAAAAKEEAAAAAQAVRLLIEAHEAAVAESRRKRARSDDEEPQDQPGPSKRPR